MALDALDAHALDALELLLPQSSYLHTMQHEMMSLHARCMTPVHFG